MPSSDLLSAPNNFSEIRSGDSAALVLAALESLKSIIGKVPNLHISSEQFKDYNLVPFDAFLTVELPREVWDIYLNVQPQAQPRLIRTVIPYLNKYNQRQKMYLILAAPWLSPESRKLCQEAGIGYLDLAGNCRLSFGTVYIERTGFNAPKAQKRDLKSLFGAKSTRILRLFLSNPNKAWKITEIGDLANVSLGQASNVRKTLLAQEWAIETKGGIQLKEPQKLLESWAAVYKPPKHQRHQFYTLLHGNALEDSLHKVMEELKSSNNFMHELESSSTIPLLLSSTPRLPKHYPGVGLVLASNSAAQYWAPYLKNPVTHLYALDLKPILHKLQAKRVDKGGNLIVDIIKDVGYFLDVREVKDDFWATSPVQTYLDLQYGGERNREAAQHLLKTIILPEWDKA